MFNVNVLAENDLNDVLMVSRQANECTSFSELQAATLRLLERIYKTSGCIFGLCKGDSFGDVTVERFAERGLDQNYIALYVSKYHKFDTLVRSMQKNSGTAPPNVMMAAQSINYDNFVRSKIYREYFSYFSVHHILCINLIFEKRPYGCIALYRSRQQNCFSKRALMKAELIASSLSGTTQNILNRKKLSDQVDITDALSVELPCSGVMVLNEKFLPLYMDAQARNSMSVLLPRAHGDDRSSRWFPDELRHCCEELLVAATSGRDLRKSNCLINIPRTGQRISCCVHMLRRVGAPLFLVYLEPQAPLVCMSERMRETGLSPREMDVVFTVSSGLTNREIADTLSISISTVQTHLRSIYEKLGIRNRTGLIHYFIK